MREMRSSPRAGRSLEQRFAWKTAFFSMKESRRFALIHVTLSVALVLLSLAGTVLAGEQAVLQASKSVFRLWSGLVLDASEDVSREVGQVLSARGYVAVDIELGRFVLFEHDQHIHVLIGHGSAYVVSQDGHLVTNDHVVHPLDHDEKLKEEFSGQELKTFVLMELEPRLRLAPFSVLWSHGSKDLAIVQARGLRAPPMPLAAPEAVVPTQRVYSIGFPGASDDLTAGGGLGDPVGYMQPKIAEGSLKARYRLITGALGWEHHAPVSGGNSGGPLVNVCGQVVGTNCATHIQVPNAQLAVALEELIPELERLLVGFVATREACTVSSRHDTPSWLYVLSGLTLFSMIGFGAYLGRLRQQMRAGLNPKVPSVLIGKLLHTIGGSKSPPEVKQEWKQDDHGRWYRYDPICGVVYRNDADEPSTSPKPAPPPPVAHPAGPRSPDRHPDAVILTSLNGLPDVVLAPGESVVVGRDPRQAGVLIDSIKISNRHVQLVHERGRVRVEDLGSTNGTFLNGRRLTEAAFMEPGEVLRLASREVAQYVIEGSRKPVPVACLQPLARGLPAIPLIPGQTVTIGRDPDNGVVIDNPHLSAHHCRIHVDPDGMVSVEDRQTQNGTFLDSYENRIVRAAMRPGQKLCLAVGEVAFKLKVGGEER